MLPRIATSSKAHLALIAIIAVTVLGALDKVSGEVALGAILLAAGVYQGTTALEDRKKKEPS